MEDRKVDYYSARLNKNNLEDFPIILGEEFYGSAKYVGSFYDIDNKDIYMVVLENDKVVVRKCFQSITASQSYSPNSENGISITSIIYASEEPENFSTMELNDMIQNKINLDLDSAFNCVQLIDEESFEFLYDVHRTNPKMDIYSALLVHSSTKGKVYEKAI